MTPSKTVLSRLNRAITEHLCNCDLWLNSRNTEDRLNFSSFHYSFTQPSKAQYSTGLSVEVLSHSYLKGSTQGQLDLNEVFFEDILPLIERRFSLT